MQTSIKNSVLYWAAHTRKYYSRTLTAGRRRALVLCACVVAVCSGAVLAEASIAKWVLNDVLEKSIIQGPHYDFMRTADAPPLSGNRHHLTMPMMLQDYLDPHLYDPLVEGLPMIVEPDFIDPDRLVELWGEEEVQQVEDDLPQFIRNRPPKIGGN